MDDPRYPTTVCLACGLRREVSRHPTCPRCRRGQEEAQAYDAERRLLGKNVCTVCLSRGAVVVQGNYYRCHTCDGTGLVPA